MGQPGADRPRPVSSCGACAHSAELVPYCRLCLLKRLLLCALPSTPVWSVRFGGSALSRDGDTKVACVLHAHLLLLFKNIGKEDVNRTVASVALSAQVSEQQWHSRKCVQ